MPALMIREDLPPGELRWLAKTERDLRVVRRLLAIAAALPSWRALSGTRRLGQAGLMMPEPVTYPGYRFPAEIISHAIWLYHVFSLSLRDVELILAERGIIVTHESIRQWGLRFGADFARKLRRRRPKPGDIWHLDEVLILSAKSGRC